MKLLLIILIYVNHAKSTSKTDVEINMNKSLLIQDARWALITRIGSQMLTLS